MLPAKNRLKLSSRNPKKFLKSTTGGDFVIKYQKSTGPFKATVSISKKTAKRAVDRNRIKRTTTEALRGLKLQDLQLVVIVKENIADLKVEEVKKRLELVLKKI